VVYFKATFTGLSLLYRNHRYLDDTHSVLVIVSGGVGVAVGNW